MPFHKLQDVTKDYISDLVLLESYSHIVCTSWDGSISMYNYDSMNRLTSLRHKFPLLSTGVVHNGKIYAGSVQGEILEVDLESEKFETVSESAELGISSICIQDASVIAGSWDGSLRIVDSRNNNTQFETTLGHKVLSMDCHENKLCISLTAGEVKIFDLRKLGVPVSRKAGLKFQARDIKIMPSYEGYVQSSLDGRVAVEYFDHEEKKFAFRCHRMSLQDAQFVFPVNTICFKPHSSTLFTGGSDGRIYAWNLSTRKKSDELPKLDSSVVKVACNDRVVVAATSDDSFKTSATVEDLPLQPSDIYIKRL